jgi:FlaA1/EpsC-like NDP-sugar epimerase
MDQHRHRCALTRTALDLPRTVKRVLALTMDAFFCVLTLWIVLSLRLEAAIRFEGVYLWPLFVSICLALPIFISTGMYRMIFRYSGRQAMIAMTKAIGLYGFLYMLLFTVVGVTGVPRSVGVFQPLLMFVAVGGSRAFVRYWLGGLYHHVLKQHKAEGVLIYGAGASGRQLVAAMNSTAEKRVLGFLDDDIRLHRHYVDGLRVYNPTELGALISDMNVSEVLLAMPSIDRGRRNEILQELLQYPLHVRTLPTMADLVSGRVSLADLHELDIEDLLGRDPVPPDIRLLNRNTHGKVVLVTGAGGSIGSELCRQILKCSPTVLLLVERNEFALYTIHQELLKSADELGADVEVIPLLASVWDELRMQEIMMTWRPDTVYHAAAYKHVPLVEHNPAEGVRNNVWGTLVCAQAAARNGVQSFVLISTDKAVRPTNIMGASKRLAELVLQSLADLNSVDYDNGGLEVTDGTCYSMVRFGNVLGSSGSVVPLFREQIRKGGPITLTHTEINRYFMTIPEAAQLVIQAGAMATGGDVFVLDMGKPVKIYDLARRMVELSSLRVREESNPNGDIEILITGLRPGEKLYEELLIGDDPQLTSHPRIMKAHETTLPWSDLESRLNELKLALDHNNVTEIRALLQLLVLGYQPTDDVVDWVTLAQEKVLV